MYLISEDSLIFRVLWILGCRSYMTGLGRTMLVMSHRTLQSGYHGLPVPPLHPPALVPGGYGWRVEEGEDAPGALLQWIRTKFRCPLPTPSAAVLLTHDCRWTMSGFTHLQTLPMPLPRAVLNSPDRSSFLSLGRKLNNLWVLTIIASSQISGLSAFPLSLYS